MEKYLASGELPFFSQLYKMGVLKKLRGVAVYETF